MPQGSAIANKPIVSPKSKSNGETFNFKGGFEVSTKTQCFVCEKGFTPTAAQFATLEHDYDPMNFVCPECREKLDEITDAIAEHLAEQEVERCASR